MTIGDSPLERLRVEELSAEQELHQPVVDHPLREIAADPISRVQLGAALAEPLQVRLVRLRQDPVTRRPVLHLLRNNASAPMKSKPSRQLFWGVGEGRKTYQNDSGSPFSGGTKLASVE